VVLGYGTGENGGSKCSWFSLFRVFFVSGFLCFGFSLFRVFFVSGSRPESRSFGIEGRVESFTELKMQQTLRAVENHQKVMMRKRNSKIGKV
jgi:hypothetical protein